MQQTIETRSKDAMTPESSSIASVLKTADDIAAQIGYPDPALRHAYHRQVLMLLSQAYVQVFGTNADSPDWVPHTGPLFPWGAPNHDTIYGFAPLDESGVYRVSGTRGTETIASLMFRKGGANTGQMHGATLGEIDVRAIDTANDGRFSLVISTEKPKDIGEPWYALPAGTTGLLARHVTETAEQRDGAWSLERLDRAPSDAVVDADAVRAGFAKMSGFVGQLNEFLLRLVKRLRDQGHTNAFVGERFPGQGGIAAQMYYQGLFEFEPDEALILESELPDAVHYWSIQLVDPFYSAIDFIFHTAAYNRTQARSSSDGKVRFVISTSDPRVPNWLDSAGWRRGAMLWRWHSASSAPVPVVRRVRLADLRRELPADTPVVDDRQRAVERAARIAHYQSRRRW
jgi:hypothetical protein